MRIRQFSSGLVLLAIGAFGAPPAGVAVDLRAHGADLSPPGRKAARPRARDERGARGPRRDRLRGGPAHALYGLEPQQLRDLETRELTRIAGHMYGLGPAELAPVSAEIARIEEERWTGETGGEEYADLIARRARLFRELTGGEDPEKLPPVMLSKLRTNPEFARLLGIIRRFEYRHPASFSLFADRLEAFIDAEKVAAAREHWRERASSLPGPFKVRGLLRGIHSRRKAGPGKAGQIGAVRSGGAKAAAKPPPGTVHRRTRPPARKPGARAAPKRNPVAEKKPATPKKARRPAGSKKGGRRAERARPLNEWERYVLEFIEEYDLTPTQRNAAIAILREMSSRASQIEQANRDRRAAAKKLTDRKQRTERLKALDAPIDDLFHAMKQRLNGLLTAVQRSKAAKPKRR